MKDTIFVSTRNGILQFLDRWKSLRTNRIIHLATYVGLACSAIALVSIGLFWNKLPTQIPIWYSKPWGTERLGPTTYLFLLPVSSIVFTVLNMVLASYLTIEYLVFSQILAIGSFVISLLSMVTLINIILLVM